MTSRVPAEPLWARVQEHRGILYEVASGYCRDPEEPAQRFSVLLLVARRAATRVPRSRFLRSVLDDVAGRSVVRATAFLDEIARLDAEDEA